ncbi:hypothetical protein EUX98_g9131 [Antrodiella citrinella]|uniref:Uncharacterized protein n=1 Tax=Antrodiella citrinella TaxID=2447956 RepID=A0A4V6S1H8_9APHY|nr:hypothetical protein EUX98_g9131 [Antrodiella citrinella]
MAVTKVNRSVGSERLNIKHRMFDIQTPKDINLNVQHSTLANPCTFNAVMLLLRLPQ